MIEFFDLFARKSAASASLADPRWADSQFPAFVQASPLRLWNLGDTISSPGARVLIGVATWSGYDMRLLDVIAAALARNSTAAPVVEVFNVADCRQLADFRKYVPGLRHVEHTPVVGVWRDGQMEQSKEGYEARELAARMFGSSAAEIVAYVRDWIKAQALAQGV